MDQPGLKELVAGPMIAPSRSPAAQASDRGRRALKWLGNAAGLTLMALPALCCRLGARLFARDEVFLFCAQTLMLVPGLPGKYLRRCFYWWTLESCSLSCDLGFLSYFTDRRVTVGERVYVGVGVTVGMATLGEGALIGNRASLLNGGHQHRFGPDGRLTDFDPASAPRLFIGAETWIGEAAVLMANVGSCCIVAAGSVVSTPVPDECIVGGNPARFIGKVTRAPSAPRTAT